MAGARSEVDDGGLRHPCGSYRIQHHPLATAVALTSAQLSIGQERVLADACSGPLQDGECS